MLSFFRKMLFNHNHRPGKSMSVESSTFRNHSGTLREPFRESAEDNAAYLASALCHTEDFVRRPLRFAGKPGLLLYLDTACDTNKIQEEVLKPITMATTEDLKGALLTPVVQKLDDLEQAVDMLAGGFAIVLMDDSPRHYAVLVSSSNNRTVSEPANERTVQGAHNGFIEDLSVNLQLVRKQLANRHLVVRRYSLGKLTRTHAALIYLHGVADGSVVEEIDRRLHAIDADNVVSTLVAYEYLERRAFSPFPQILQTERPDRVVGNLLEGRIALLADNSPAALVMPVTFFSFYQSPDDYNSRSLDGSFIRILRLFSFLIAIMLPAYYIAVMSFHYEVVPNELFYQIKGSIEQIPYPPILEALFMELTLELLREAGIRLPGPVGQSIGIVGGLVIGDAVVRVGLVSYPMIIVVALTAIASFVVPVHEMSYSVRLLRFPFMLSAAILGFLGIVFFFGIMLIHLCKLESFGTPYFAPAAPLRLKDWKDTLIRLPFWRMKQRPIDAQPHKLIREHSPSEGGDEP